MWHSAFPVVCFLLYDQPLGVGVGCIFNQYLSNVWMAWMGWNGLESFSLIAARIIPYRKLPDNMS